MPRIFSHSDKANDYAFEGIGDLSHLIYLVAEVPDSLLYVQ